MTAAAISAARRVPRPQLLLIAVAAALAAAVTTGTVALPDLEKTLTGVSDSLGAWTYALVAGLAFLETGAFVGLIAPGETAVVLGGVAAARGDVELAVVLGLVWVAAALGDLVSFLLGRRLGPAFLVKHGRRLGLRSTHVERVERFAERHGPRAVLVGRFIGIVRAVAPFLAGAGGLAPRRFIPWSLLGTLAWSASFTLVGFVFWRSFTSAAHTLTHVAFALAVVAAIVLAVRSLRTRQTATA